MLEILNNIKQQIGDLIITPKTVSDLNDFFKTVNTQLKGDNSTLVTVYRESADCRVLSSNLLADSQEIVSAELFKKELIEYLEQFADNTELLFDIIELLIETGVCRVSHSLKLLLFKKLFNTGCFCYIPLTGAEFIEDFDYFKFDLCNIANCVDFESFREISEELQSVTSELYYCDCEDSPVPNWSLKEYLI